MVTDADTGAGLAGAEVEVEDRADKRVTSSARGEFWRLLLPGTYTLRSVGARVSNTIFERSKFLLPGNNVTFQLTEWPSDPDKLNSVHKHF